MTAQVALSEWATTSVARDLQQQRLAASVLDEALLCAHNADEEGLLVFSAAPAFPQTARSTKRQCISERAAGGGKAAAANKKPWYMLKKDEKRYLAKEIGRLESLRQMLQLSATSRAISLLTLQQENERLRHVIWESQMRHARAQSAISDRSRTMRLPFEKTIRLGSSQADRVATLAELKHPILNDAEHYINERAMSIDSTQEHTHVSSFTAPNGDYCFSGFDVLHLDGFTSVKQVFDAMRIFYFNMEITWTETSNDLMLREGEYESGDQDVAFQRFVRLSPCGTQVESNTVLFSRFQHEGGSESESAVLVVNFVDEDELFPYKPSERFRQDITAVITVKASPKKEKPGQHGASSECELVMTRAFFGRLHTSEEMEIPSSVVHSVVDGCKFWFRTMLKTVRELAKSSTAS